jgi:hypothetical protein
MELKKGYTDVLKVPFPTGAASATAKIYKDTVLIGSTVNLTITSGVAPLAIPYGAVATEGQVRAEITFHVGSTTYVKNILSNVITPYLELWQIKEILTSPTHTPTDQECWDIEASARYIIDTVCGQNFGNRTKSISLWGNDEGSLRMPERLISFSTITSSLGETVDLEALAITTDHNYLRYMGIPSRDQTITMTDVITVPWSTHAAEFNSHAKYTIAGVFGWETVPYEVVEAAKLLVNDYSCSENMYRDRYIQSISTADWKLIFASQVFEDTGNARADTLLDAYKVLYWAVI